MASISNFGQTGPYRDFKATDLILTAMGYEMYSHGLPDLPPLKSPLTRDLICMGGSAAAGVMAAYYGARWKGVPQYLDLAIFEMQLCGIDFRMACLMAYQYSGRVNERIVTGGAIISGSYRCQDGYVEVAAGPQYLPRVIEMVGDERLKNPVFLEKDIYVRKPERLEELNAIWFSWLERHTRKELDEIFLRYKLQAAIHQTPAEVANDPHFTVRDCFIEVEHPVMGRVRTLGRPLIMEKAPWQLRTPAPLLGQHNEEVYGKLGYGNQDLVQLKQLGII
jgi:crotonobetainyl-CoA:carnitine CoA-transferase CaiB-like acyl-CoA transferase